MKFVSDLLLEIWTGPIKENYSRGKICSERHLQCELYHLLRLNSNLDVWIEPTLIVKTGDTGRTMKPNLLISQANEILAVLEIKNVPDGEAAYKADVEKLVLFESSSTATYHLETDLATGRFKQDVEFKISKHLLCVYAAISRGNFAYSVKPTKFWLSNDPDIKLPKNFLHLVGRLYKNDLRFCESVHDEMC